MVHFYTTELIDLQWFVEKHLNYEVTAFDVVEKYEERPVD